MAVVPDNPIDGTQLGGQGGAATGWKSREVEVLQLSNDGNPMFSTKYFGVYPKSWKPAEYNYGTSEFHTVSVVFKYDYMDHGLHGTTETALAVGASVAGALGF